MEHEHTHHEGSDHGETHHESKKGRRQNSKSIIAIVIAAIIIIIVGFLVWLYTGSLSQAKQNVFKKVSLPAAIVDMKFLPAKFVMNRIALANQLAQAQGSTSSTDKGQVYSQIIDAKKLEAVASHHHVSPSSGEIDEEYGNIVKQYANGDSGAFEKELQDTYHMNSADFKDQVVRQEILQSDLTLWYNQQRDLNKDAYAKADDLMGKLNSGQSFDDVSKGYTQDESTKDFAGDSGVIGFSDLLPEFRDALKDAKVGDTRVVASRYGLHILKVLELNDTGDNGQKQIHLQQIYIKPAGFDDWLAKETDNIRVLKLLKF